MARTLPLYVNALEVEVANLPGAEPANGMYIQRAGGGNVSVVLVGGMLGSISAPGGKVTVNFYDDPVVADALLFYSVELDFTGTTTASIMQDPPIPMINTDSVCVTLTGDGVAAGKEFLLLPYLMKPAVVDVGLG